MPGQTCICGFQFSGSGEFRNCEAFLTAGGESGVICPKCGATYIGDRRVKISPSPDSSKAEHQLQELELAIFEQETLIAAERLSGNIVKEEFHKGALFGLRLAQSLMENISKEHKDE
jgi:hypothetical protein